MAMRPRDGWVVLLAFMGTVSLGSVLGSGTPAAQFEGKDTLLRPDGYREWVFVGSSLGLSYEKGESERPGKPEYKNVYIDPAAYRAYKESGAFPQGTVLVLETTTAEDKREPGLRGSFQQD